MEDCRDSDGCLHHVRQGKHGMGLVVSYLSKINWTGSPLDLVEIKLQQLLTELKCVQYVLLLLSVIHTECYLGEWMLPSDPQATCSCSKPYRKAQGCGQRFRTQTFVPAQSR